VTVRELIARLIQFPNDAQVMGFLDPKHEVKGLGILVIWERDERLHREFIETPFLAGTPPAPPKKATGKRKG
jgi:hypothetical protein